MSGSVEDTIVMQSLVDAARSGQSVVGGLHAAAEDMPNRRSRQRLERLAAAIEQGVSISDACQSVLTPRQRYLAKLVDLGIHTNSLPGVLSEIIDIELQGSARRREVWESCRYPLIVLVVALGVGFAAYRTINSSQMSVFGSVSEAQSSGSSSNSLAGIVDLGWGWYLGAGAIVCSVLLLTRLCVGRERWGAVMASLPIIGPLIITAGLLELTHRWRLLLDFQVPLPMSLRLVGDSLRNAYLGRLCRRAAFGVEHGRSVASVLAESAAVPPLLCHTLAWGEKQNALPESLQLASTLLTRQLEFRLRWLRLALPSIAFLLVAIIVLSLAWHITRLMQVYTFLADVPTLHITSLSWQLQVLGGIVLGFAIVRVASIWMRHSGQTTGLGFGMRLAGWILVWGSLGSLVGGITGWYAIPIFIAVAMMVQQRYRQSDRAELAWVIQQAGRYQLPLPATLRAFVANRWDDFAERTRGLAEFVEKGVPLDRALWQARTPLPLAELLAIRLADGTYDTTSLAQSTSRAESTYRTERLAAASLAGLVAATQVLQLLVMLFLYHNTMPMLTTTFLTSATPTTAIQYDSEIWRLTSDAGMFLGDHPSIAILLVILLIATTVVGFFVYVGWYDYHPRTLRYIGSRYHRAMLLKLLGHNLSRQEPLPYGLEKLAEHYPVPWVQKKLKSVVRQVLAGRGWVDAMRDARLLSSTESALLKSAARNGNQAWAAEELSDRAFRRLTASIHWSTRTLVPLAVILGAAPLLLTGCLIMTLLARAVMSFA